MSGAQPGEPVDGELRERIAKAIAEHFNMFPHTTRDWLVETSPQDWYGEADAVLAVLAGERPE